VRAETWLLLAICACVVVGVTLAQVLERVFQ
jgi:hypothetical protein